MSSASRKPFYKSWPFITLVVILLLGPWWPEPQKINDSSNIIEPVEKSDLEKKNPTKKIETHIQKIIDVSGLSEAEAIVVYNNMLECGFSKLDSIENISTTSQVNSQVFVAVFDGYKIKLNIDKGKLTYAAMGNIDFYDDLKGGVTDNINNYKIDSTAKIDYMFAAEKYVKNMLKAPSTAKFPSKSQFSDQWTVIRYLDVVTISSYVDAQNSFGAMLRNEFMLQINANTSELTYMHFDNEVIFGEIKPMHKNDF